MHRFEDERLLRGTSRFVEDLDTADCLHAVFVRSPHAHARIVSFDSRAARESEGVQGGLRRSGLPGRRRTPARVFASRLRAVTAHPSTLRPGTCWRWKRHDSSAIRWRWSWRVRSMPPPTRRERVEVEYEPLPVVVDPRGERRCRGGAADRRFRSDDFRVLAGRPRGPGRVHANNRMWAAPIETRSAIGRHDSLHDTYRLDTQSQGVHVMRTLVAASLGIDEDRLRVVTPDVGGSFGMKLVNYPEQERGAGRGARARRAGALGVVDPAPRLLLTDTHARGHHSVAELALDEEGRILALRCTTHGDMGGLRVRDGHRLAGHRIRFVPSPTSTAFPPST